MMNNIYLITLSLFAFLSCANANDGKKETKKEVVAQKKQAATQVEGIPYVNGVSDKNRGDSKGKIKLSGSIVGAKEGTKVLLFSTIGKTNTVIDSTTIKSEKFEFKANTYKQGFYALALNKRSNIANIILNPSEKEVTLNYKSLRLGAKNALTSPNSIENQAYAEYIIVKQNNDVEVKKLKKARSNSTQKERYKKMIEQEWDKLIVERNALIQKYPDTYFAKIMTWHRSEYKSNIAKYWADIDMTDESLLRSPVLNDRIQEFMITHSGGKDAGFYTCIDHVVTATKVNENVLEHALYAMLDGFYTSNMETICTYIMDSYIFGDSCGDVEISNVLKQHAAGVQSLQIGNVPPDFSIKDADGKVVTLSNEYKKHDYTLVMFWSSWCHKCEQEIPVLKSLYEKNHSKGFQVVGVSVDQSRSSWTQALNKKGMAWPNVSQLNGWQSPVALDYHVSSTPVLFLVDKEGKIVLKPKRIYEVGNFLNANLK